MAMSRLATTRREGGMNGAPNGDSQEFVTKTLTPEENGS